jgi:hypothetical protein
MVSLLECLAQACATALDQAPRVEVHSLAQDQTADGPASVAAHAASAGAHVTLAEARTVKVRTAVVADATDKISSNSDAG